MYINLKWIFLVHNIKYPIASKPSKHVYSLLLYLFRVDGKIKHFLEDTDPESTLDVGADMRKIKYCFCHLKVHFIYYYLPQGVEGF